MPVDCSSDTRDLARTWHAVLGHLQIDLSQQNYETWFVGSRPVTWDEDSLIVEPANTFNLEWMNEQFQFVVQRAVERVAGRRLRVLFVPRGGRSARTPEGVASGVVCGTINRRFTFERHLEAEANRLARRSCFAVVSGDTWAVSPIVVIGAPGMGKSHLLHALAGRVAADGASVACLSAEEFTSRYMCALRQGSVDAFQASVRGVRLLVIDDLQYLSGKKKGTQDELVHTIDAISNAGGVVAIASERHPSELELPDRLASRLGAGIVSVVGPFLLDERRAFIQTAAEELKVALPDWAVERVAGMEAPSVRALQGAVHAAAHLALSNMLDRGKLDAELCRLTREVAAEAVATNDAAMLEAVAAHFSTTVEDLAGRSRKANLSRARSVAVAALQQRGRSLREIGTTLNRDHSTVRELADRGRTLLEECPELRARVAG